MSVIFQLSGTKFDPRTVTLDCKKKPAGAPIKPGMTEIITNDDKKKINYYDCSLYMLDDVEKVKEKYITSFTLSGPNGGPNDGAFDGPRGYGYRGSLFNKCTPSLGLPPGNPNNLTLIDQYELGKPLFNLSACKFNSYFNLKS